MKITIIVDDNAVYVDNVSHVFLDLSLCGIPNNVSALQWKDTAGWIEFKDNNDGSKPQNQSITELPVWVNNCIDVYNAWTAPVPVPAPNQPTTIGTQTA